MASNAGAQPVGLFLVGVSEALARSVARYLVADPRVALVGVAPSLALASLLLPQIQPDVVLLDWAQLSGATAEAIPPLRAGRPRMRLVCVVGEAEAYRAAATQADADAVISKEHFASELEPLLRAFFPERFR